MPTKYNLTHLRAIAAGVPGGREAHLLARAGDKGNILMVGNASRKRIEQKFPQSLSWRCDIAKLKSFDQHWPSGFVEFVLARGKVNEGVVVVTKPTIFELQERFPCIIRPRKPSLPPVPTLFELAANFTGAMSGWAKAGFKVVNREKYEHRHAICLACEFWRPDAMFGTGKCLKCRCSRVKLWLVSSKCPDKPARW
jgi:hypothetical protein